MPKITRALLSVSDKTGLVEFAKFLSNQKIELLSTGGTAKLLRDSNIPVIDVSEYTGFPEVMDGRLKTLHPKIEGGLLGIRANPNHQKAMQELGIPPIDLVVVNLYPFESTVSKPNCQLHEAIENIDIGGPTMLRAASKNYQDVTVVVDPADYFAVQSEMQNAQNSVSVKTNFKLASKVFEFTARYDALISQYLASKQEKVEGTSDFPVSLSLPYEKAADLRYGENPHQKAACYRSLPKTPGGLVDAQVLQGKELSYNNYIDLDAALQLVREFIDPACAIIKHTNPCGAAIGKNALEAFTRARESDPVSAFGGIVAINQKIDAKLATAMAETFFECILAPEFTSDALEVFKAKKNLRLLTLNPWSACSSRQWQLRKISGGLLVQDADTQIVAAKEAKVVTKRAPTEAELIELDFAWKVSKHVKSNAIVLTRDHQLLGAGAGQMSRVDSVKIAISKSQKATPGAVMASDAFFPFRDGLDLGIAAGVTAVIQPGGSVRDAEVIAAADEAGIAMVFTGMRHFKH